MPFNATSSVPCFSDMEERLERAGLSDAEFVTLAKDLFGGESTPYDVETPEMLLQSKKDLDTTLLSSPDYHKSYYKISQAQNREVTDRETDWLAFLRAERYELKVRGSMDVDPVYYTKLTRKAPRVLSGYCDAYH